MLEGTVRDIVDRQRVGIAVMPARVQVVAQYHGVGSVDAVDIHDIAAETTADDGTVDVWRIDEVYLLAGDGEIAFSSYGGDVTVTGY